MWWRCSMMNGLVDESMNKCGRMRSFIHSSIHLFILCLLPACGFKPMAAEVQRVPLPQIEVKVDGGNELRVLAADFGNKLEDLLSQHTRSAEKYALEVSVSTTSSGGLVAPDGKAQRYTMTINSFYTLKRKSDDVAVDSGSVARSGSYLNRPNVYFSTFVSEQDTVKRLSKELAEEYHLLLASRLGSPEKLEMETAPTNPAKRGIFNSIF
jgi:hypothetical protein